MLRLEPGDVVPAVARLPSMHKALSSMPTTSRKQTTKNIKANNNATCYIQYHEEKI
jgi:hypothetical protein